MMKWDTLQHGYKKICILVYEQSERAIGFRMIFIYFFYKQLFDQKTWSNHYTHTLFLVADFTGIVL